MSRKVVAGYTLSRRIGHGSFAVVFEGVHRSGHTAAIKAISRARLSDRLKENLKSEIAILQQATHPNIVQLYSIENSTRHIYVRCCWPLHARARGDVRPPAPLPLLPSPPSTRGSAHANNCRTHTHPHTPHTHS